MKYNPTESSFISYLYGEMPAKEKKQMEAWLTAHPEKADELKQMGQARSIMQQLEDQSVSVPLNLLVQENQSGNNKVWWQTWSVRAAAIGMLLMLTAYFTNLNIQWKDQHLLISFGDAPQLLNAEDVLNSQRAFLAEESRVRNDWQQQQDSLNQQWGAQLVALSEQLGEIDMKTQRLNARQSSQTASLTTAQIDQLKKELIESNYQLMTDLLLDASRYQKDYTEQLLTEFSRFIEQQRLQDLQLMELALNNVLEQADEQQQNTEIMLAEIITQMRQTD